MDFQWTHYDKNNKIIYQAIITTGNSVSFYCPICNSAITCLNIQSGANFTYWFITRPPNFPKTCRDDIKYGSTVKIQTSLFEDEMPTAKLTYELLDEQSGEGAYKLKLEGNFKHHIEPMVQFIKKFVPSADRTYDPTSFEWHYHERWQDIMLQAFKAGNWYVDYVISKEQYADLKRKQDEFARQAGQQFQTRQVPIEEDLQMFEKLLAPISNGDADFLELKNWSREQAIRAWKRALRFYHPDLHPERASQASQLNEVWGRLKEGYYIK